MTIELHASSVALGFVACPVSCAVLLIGWAVLVALAARWRKRGPPGPPQLVP